MRNIAWMEGGLNGYAEVLDELQDGDAIIVAELARLGRNMLESMDILALAFDRIKFYGTFVSFV